MAVLFSLSDPHGEIETFKKMLKIVDLQDKENKLVLLGDYIDHKQKKFELLYFIKNLQEQYNDQLFWQETTNSFYTNSFYWKILKTKPSFLMMIQ